MTNKKSCLKNCCICKKPFFSEYPNKKYCGSLGCKKIAERSDQKKYRNNVKLRLRKKVIQEVIVKVNEIKFNHGTKNKPIWLISCKTLIGELKKLEIIT